MLDPDMVRLWKNSGEMWKPVQCSPQAVLAVHYPFAKQPLPLKCQWTQVQICGELFLFIVFFRPLLWVHSLPDPNFFPITLFLFFPSFFPSLRFSPPFFCVLLSPFPLPSFLFSFSYSFPIPFLSFSSSCFLFFLPYLMLFFLSFPPLILFS